MSNTPTSVCNHPTEKAKDIQRLNRISGQVEGVKKMLEEQRYCPDVITQLRAIRAAVRALEANILENHLHATIAAAFQSKTKDERAENIDEVKDLYKRFDE